MSFDPEEVPPEDWVRDPHTLKLLKRYGELRKDAFDCLMDACEASTDPEVRGRLERYKAARAFSLHLNGGKIGSKTDGT